MQLKDVIIGSLQEQVGGLTWKEQLGHRKKSRELYAAQICSLKMTSKGRGTFLGLSYVGYNSLKFRTQKRGVNMGITYYC